MSDSGGRKAETVSVDLRRAQRMATAGQLAASVAHDLNNLLFVVINYAELILDRHDSGLPTRMEITELLGTARRASALTAQLLAFGRRRAPKRERIDLGALLSGIDGALRRLVGPEVELSIHCADALWPVLGDRAHLEQVLINLTTNARDAMDGRGTLTIDAANANLDAGPYVQLTVRDSGSGMDEATKVRLFEPFFTTKAEAQGTGLGLAVALEIVQDSGGSIAVESSPGCGASFCVSLPRAE
jgi:two-component system cell cycle sensor histidine kinase/response regulator CckA